jgi:DNA-binding CsgD family transcriptional regulator
LARNGRAADGDLDVPPTLTTPTDEPWAEGATIDDPRLALAVATVWAEAVRLGGDEVAPEPPRGFAAAQEMVSEASMALVGVLETPVADGDPMPRQVRAGHLLAALNAVSADLRDAAFAYRVRAFGRVQAAGARLRGLAAVAPMLKATAGEICRCGFDRAIVLRVVDGIATLESAHDVASPEGTELLQQAARVPFKVDPSLPEAEMIRRRSPLLVTDALTLENGKRDIIDASGTRSYVAAPLLSQGRLIGIAVADCLHSRRVMDDFDRDLLWLFAQEFGTAYEHATLLERLAALRHEIRRANQSILTVMDEFVDAELEVARIDRENGALTQSAASVFVAADSRIDQLLTRRELDVAGLMASGETNAGIAAKLVVSEATVKSHVKHILRKLRASNRAEAVSRIIGLSRGPGGAGGTTPPV